MWGWVVKRALMMEYCYALGLICWWWARRKAELAVRNAVESVRRSEVGQVIRERRYWAGRLRR